MESIMESVASLICPEELVNALRSAMNTQEKTLKEAIVRHAETREDIDYCCIVVAHRQIDFLRKEINKGLKAIDTKAMSRDMTAAEKDKWLRAPRWAIAPRR